MKDWLEKHPHITLHFTPTGASWLNMVEVFSLASTDVVYDRTNLPGK